MKVKLLFFLFIIQWFVLGISAADEWVAIPGHMNKAYYSKESIQMPHIDIYDFGLFTVGKLDKDIVRVWTKFYIKDWDVPRILYEINFSTRVYKKIYAVNQYGNRIPELDMFYKPILPGSLESDLFNQLKADPNLKMNECLFSGITLDQN
jgi:hypothetical protein